MVTINEIIALAERAKNGGINRIYCHHTGGLYKMNSVISLLDITLANINASVIPNSSYCFPIILSSLVYLISKYILNNKCASVNILFMCFGVSLCDVYLI